LGLHLVAGNVANARCLVSKRLAGSGVLVGLVLGLLSLCKQSIVSDNVYLQQVQHAAARHDGKSRKSFDPSKGNKMSKYLSGDSVRHAACSLVDLVTCKQVLKEFSTHGLATRCDA